MALTEQHKRYLRLMGIQAWEARSVSPPAFEAVRNQPDQAVAVVSPEPSTEEEIPANALQTAPAVVSMDWGPLRETVLRCRQCDLHQTRTQAVFGVGNQRAQWMVVGEAPGADEDKQGEPFVGRAGQLLNNMLYAIGLKRDEVYIANVLKCRPPNNRDPKPEEAVQCSEYLFRQISLIQPKLILVLGRIAAQRLLKTDTSLGRLRGKLHQHSETGVPLIVTYHPAYLLRTPSDKRKAWQDLLFLRKTIQSK